MPELPEVETVARQLAPALTGRRVVAVQVFDPKIDPASLEPLSGRTITAVRRIGKQVGIGFSQPGIPEAGPWLCIHLRMTGRLAWVPDCRQPPVAPLRVRFRLDRGALLFHDTRRFGTLTLYPTLRDATPAGIDPTGRAFTPARLAAWLAQSASPIKVWLMRQDRLVGLGNIYVSEALHRAGIHPARPARSLSFDEAARLHKALRLILRSAIRCGGTTIFNFENAVGAAGQFQRRLRVYGREGDPCARCRTPIQRLVQQQRSTFFCPTCQH